VIGAAGLLWVRRTALLAVTCVLGMLLLVRRAVISLHPNDPAAGEVLGSLLRPLEDPLLAGFIFAFCVGACAALYADHIVLDSRLGIACLVVYFLIARWDGPPEVLGAVPLLYAMLWAGHQFVIPGWSRLGDPSYGVYLYGWPVQSLFAEYGLHQRLGIHLYLLVCIAVATALGWVSWHLIERQAMKLKSWDPQWVFTAAHQQSRRRWPANRRKFTDPPAAGTVVGRVGGVLSSVTSKRGSSSNDDIEVRERANL
jgi:peptidoglycan/LPS O-acetylase OafA/YrhL